VTRKGCAQSDHKEKSRKTELRSGIGLCDGCVEPRWPQEYVGYGIMLCLDCIEKDKPERREGGG
jgi:hypothetical protein